MDNRHGIGRANKCVMSSYPINGISPWRREARSAAEPGITSSTRSPSCRRARSMRTGSTTTPSVACVLSGARRNAEFIFEVQSCYGAGFACEAVGELVMGNLQRNDPVQPGIASLEDLAHSALADRRDHLVRTK